MQNPLSAPRYTQSLNSTKIQALVVSIKQLIGYMLIVAIVIMVISRFTPFHKTLKVAVPRTGEDMFNPVTNILFTFFLYF